MKLQLFESRLAGPALAAVILFSLLFRPGGSSL